MRKVLPIIVIAQFFCTSLWFSGIAIISDMAMELNLDKHFLAHLKSAIQFGFIIGTFSFAIFTVSDRFSPSKVFFSSAIIAGLFNLGLCINKIDPTQILLFRFLTGFFLAGIYPVGMKIASDYYQYGLGKSLGFLVGALVLGTAFPHLLKGLSFGLPWKYVLYATTSFSVIGGLSILLLVPDGPYRKTGQKIKLNAFLHGFKKQQFRSVSFGYFGHMWELYSFWAFVPFMLIAYQKKYPEMNLNVSLYAFFIIASGGFACVFSGLLSQIYGAQKIAKLSLLLSCCCCLLSPLFLFANSFVLFLSFLFFWAMVVIADSPLFSTLVAQHAPEASRGSSLTIVNCIGFSITVISIQLINWVSDTMNAQFIYMLLAIGPLLGLIGLRNKRNW